MQNFLLKRQKHLSGIVLIKNISWLAVDFTFSANKTLAETDTSKFDKELVEAHRKVFVWERSDENEGIHFLSSAKL